MTEEHFKRAKEIDGLIGRIGNTINSLNHRDFANHHGLDIGNGWDGAISIDDDLMEPTIKNTVVMLVVSSLESRKKQLEDEFKNL